MLLDPSVEPLAIFFSSYGLLDFRVFLDPDPIVKCLLVHHDCRSLKKWLHKKRVCCAVVGKSRRSHMGSMGAHVVNTRGTIRNAR